MANLGEGVTELVKSEAAFNEVAKKAFPESQNPTTNEYSLLVHFLHHIQVSHQCTLDSFLY
jgi:hypothetical protein